MASRKQLVKRLNYVLGTKLDVEGLEPPRLVRANSAFSKRTVVGKDVVETDK